jgi:GH25 family lysozyme M1 (1,4-beta-N-acetylmuramidase)
MSDNIFHGAYVDNSAILAHGIDISKWNGDINWAEIKAAGVDFVIIKAGSSFGKDPRFEEHYANAKAAGLGVGCYYYSYALTVDEISADADLFMSWIAGKQFDYPVYLDIEDPTQEVLDKALLTEMCVTFIEKMQINGYFCGIYTNRNWLTNLLHTETITLNFDLWLAHWLNSGEPNWPSSFGAKTGMWQYTDKGTIGTHSCYFDLNVAFKDYPSLIKQWGYNGY